MSDREGTSPPIRASRALYIKLGQRGEWERECIEEKQTLHVGYHKVADALCRGGKWDEVADRLSEGRDRGAATRHANQIRLFYESGPDTLWITFYRGLLWWCFSKPEVILLEDKSKMRPVLGSWRANDVEGVPLQISGLSGKLLMLQGFRGTICAVKEREYLIRKINGEREANVLAAEVARDSLVGAVQTIIRSLHWRDFELLVDLIFTNAGWKRVSEVGGTQKTLDLILDVPIVRKRYGVQIKSQADKEHFEAYKAQVETRPELERSYFVVHSPSQRLEEYAERTTSDDKVKVLGPRQVAEWSVRYGLTDWVMDKAG